MSIYKLIIKLLKIPVGIVCFGVSLLYAVLEALEKKTARKWFKAIIQILGYCFQFPFWKTVYVLKKIFCKPKTYKRKPGRPSITAEIKRRILDMKRKNPNWGPMRIKLEMLKLGFDVSHETIRKVLAKFRKFRPIPPNGSWQLFLDTKWTVLSACDFFCVKVRGVMLYVFFIIKLETREIVQFGVTDHPNTQFLKGQLSTFSSNYPDSYLIHDNSGELQWFPYSEYGIKGVSIVPYTPNMNAYAERWVRTIRQECLNHFLVIFNNEHLYKIVKDFVYFYNECRPHQRTNDIPNGSLRDYPKTGIIKRKSMVAGLQSHYYREAA